MNSKEIEIPEGVKVSYNDGLLDITGPNGNIQREFKNPFLTMEVKDSKVVISTPEKRKKIKALLGTWTSHTKNMISSAENMWEAKLRVVYSHFPMKIKYDDKESRVVIENFLGGRSMRYAKIRGNVKIDIKGNDVIVTGMNKEEVGQAAANIEQATRVRGFDKRIFQDGCHLVQKTKIFEKE